MMRLYLKQPVTHILAQIAFLEFGLDEYITWLDENAQVSL